MAGMGRTSCATKHHPDRSAWNPISPFSSGGITTPAQSSGLFYQPQVVNSLPHPHCSLLRGFLNNQYIKNILPSSSPHPKQRGFASSSSTFPQFVWDVVQASISHYFLLTYFPYRNWKLCCVRRKLFLSSRRLNSREAQVQTAAGALWVLPSLLNFSSVPKGRWMVCWNPQLPLQQGIHLMQSQQLPHCIPTGKHHHKVGLHKLCPKAVNEWGLKSISSSKQINLTLLVSQLSNWIWEEEQLDLRISNSNLTGKEGSYVFIISFFPISHKP